MKRVLFAHALLICGLALTLGGELSAGRSAAATRLAAEAEAAAAAATTEATTETATATMDVALQVNGSPMAFRGRGECHFTDAGSIYERPARAWGATIDTDTRYVNFASWRLKQDDRELMNLMVRIGETEHRVSTVKVGDQGTVRGAGGSTFTKQGAGGVFTIDATSDKGARITGRLTCSAFGSPEDNG